MDGSRALQKYNRYYQWWDNIERKIFKLAVLLFIVLYTVHFVNFILVQRGIAFLNSSVVKLEGVSVAESQTQINTGTVELTVTSNSDYSNIQIFLNGEYYRNFDRKTVSLTVKNNDIIEVSGIKNEYPATIKISALTDNIISPKPDSVVIVNRNFVQAARIRLK